jgi:hypothetical protein
MRRLLVRKLPLMVSLNLNVYCHAATVWVDPNGTGDCREIQPAAYAAAEGDVVLVAPGVGVHDH